MSSIQAVSLAAAQDVLSTENVSGDVGDEDGDERDAGDDKTAGPLASDGWSSALSAALLSQIRSKVDGVDHSRGDGIELVPNSFARQMSVKDQVTTGALGLGFDSTMTHVFA